MERPIVSTVLLDTHVLVWVMEGNQHLGHGARQLADMAGREDTLVVSAITFWEVAMLIQCQRLILDQPITSWRQKALELGVSEIPVSGDISILSAGLKHFPADPADRIITATAVIHGATLITADARILGWQGRLRRHDARS
jgi:PIN domain nuclease of toxin-antitoxin system